MATLAEIREQYPQYRDMSDEALAGALHQKFYADMPPAEFNAKMGLKSKGHNVPEFDPGIEGYNPETGEVERSRGASFAHGAADMASAGFADELASTLVAPFSEKTRPEILAQMRAAQAQAQAGNPGWYLGGQVAGGLAQAGALGPAGFAANAARTGGTLGRVALGASADAAALGGAYGLGSGVDAGDRLTRAGIGAGTGAIAGAVAPYAIAGVQAATRPMLSPVLARLNPGAYASRALEGGLRRADMSPDDVAASLTAARVDGQDMFNVADAMGHSGQRMLSTVARNPNEMRQTVADTLTQRQMGQGERVARTLSEGFNAPDTAAARAASLSAERSALANVNYEMARQGAGAVDVSGALAVADDILTPGINRLANPGSNIADDSLEGVVRRARSLLTDGRSNLTDFGSVLRAKQDIADMIGAASRAGRNNQVRLLAQINDSLDAALERASPAYRAANDAFRAQSRTIDAVETGRAAASGRTRAADNIATFQSMRPGERNAFRAGYSDPLISRVEAGATSPTTNLVRPLITEKTGQEFSAFAVPQRAPAMSRRLGREQTMFSTANTALGGSKTADNLADAAEMSKFDPGVMMNLLRGRPVAAALDAVGRLANEARGMPPQVLERVAQALLETNPAAAQALLSQGAGHASRTRLQQALASVLMGNLGGLTGGRLAAD